MSMAFLPECSRIDAIEFSGELQSVEGTLVMTVAIQQIGVLMGGRSSEREISLKSGDAVFQSLRRQGYRVTKIDVDENLPQVIRRRKVQLAFLVLHGPGGEDGTVQGLLEIMGIPYTGSGVRASAVGMDKGMSKAVLQPLGMPLAPGVMVNRNKVVPSVAKLGWPLVVKPNDQGSTVGVSIVHRPSEWKRALSRAFEQSSQVLVEAYVAGREIAAAVLDGRALPLVEIVAPGGFYDYAAKYQKSDTRYVCPALVTKKQAGEMQVLAKVAFETLGCEGAARVDFRLTRGGRPVFLEINTIPGMTERSLLPMAAAEAGIDYDGLTKRILQTARKRRMINPIATKSGRRQG